MAKILCVLVGLFLLSSCAEYGGAIKARQAADVLLLCKQYEEVGAYVSCDDFPVPKGE